MANFCFALIIVTQRLIDFVFKFDDLKGIPHPQMTTCMSVIHPVEFGKKILHAPRVKKNPKTEKISG